MFFGAALLVLVLLLLPVSASVAETMQEEDLAAAAVTTPDVDEAEGKEGVASTYYTGKHTSWAYQPDRDRCDPTAPYYPATGAEKESGGFIAGVENLEP